MPALLEFFKTQVQQLEAQTIFQQGPLVEPAKFHVNPEPPKQIPQAPILASGMASLPHPAFFLDAPQPLASASEIDVETSDGSKVHEQAEGAKMEDVRKRTLEVDKLPIHPLDGPDGQHDDVVENF